MSAWPIACDYCIHIADSQDSYADSRADLAVHVHLSHPGKPLPGTWTIADVRSIPGVLAREATCVTAAETPRTDERAGALREAAAFIADTSGIGMRTTNYAAGWIDGINHALEELERRAAALGVEPGGGRGA